MKSAIVKYEMGGKTYYESITEIGEGQLDAQIAYFIGLLEGTVISIVYSTTEED